MTNPEEVGAARGEETAELAASPDAGRPFAPSWIDRFNRWVGRLPTRLPMPAWLFYALVAAALILVQLLVLWLEGGLQATELLPVIIFNGLVTPFLLALIALLDRQAAAALHAMRPVLAMSRAEADRYAFRLSHMPFAPPLVAGLVMLAVVLLMEQLGNVPVRYAALADLPFFNVVFFIVDKSSAFLFGVFFYHTYRQLRLVNAVNSKDVRINLFNVGPLQAFSRVTATTAVGLLVGIYGWVLINPDLLADPVSLGFALAVTVLAVAVFVWPLYGAHRLLVAAKNQALGEIDGRFETVFARFNQAFGDDDFAAIAQLNGLIGSLEIQRQKIAAVPTWPWSPGTVRSVLAAIVVPLIWTMVQYLVQLALN